MSPVVMGMRLKLVLLSILMLASVALGVPENVVMVPYNVSFDLNATVDYEIEILGPEYFETVDGVGYVEDTLILNGTDYFTFISIRRFDYPIVADNESTRREAEAFLERIGCRDIQSYSRKIDHQGAFVATGKNIFNTNEVYALSWLDRVMPASNDYVATLLCTISSDLPSDVVVNLLDTIHVGMTSRKNYI